MHKAIDVDRCFAVTYLILYSLLREAAYLVLQAISQAVSHPFIFGNGRIPEECRLKLRMYAWNCLRLTQRISLNLVLEIGTLSTFSDWNDGSFTCANPERNSVNIYGSEKYLERKVWLRNGTQIYVQHTSSSKFWTGVRFQTFIFNTDICLWTQAKSVAVDSNLTTLPPTWSYWSACL
jgi:hypothetical protein